MSEPRIILDFDHTLMDTDRFVESAKADGLTMEEIVTPEIWTQYNVRDFLYEDVMDWFKTQQKENLYILTACTPTYGAQAIEFQKEKLHSGKFEEFVSGITFMVGDKGDYVKELYDGRPTYFVDDSLAHQESVQNTVPEVVSVLIDRPNSSHVQLPTNENIKVVHDLAGLDAIIAG